MGLTHIRTPKNFVLEERLTRYGAAIEKRPEAFAGRWAEACFAGLGTCPDAATDAAAPAARGAAGTLPRFRRVHLDLGCGKGAFLCASAAHEPETLFIGMDIEPICIAYAAQRVCEAQLANAVIVPRGAGALARIFAPGELDALTLNFPTPYPRAHDAARRLTGVDQLLAYRPLLAPGARVTLRTDSQPLRDYTLGQLAAAGYRVIWSSDDVRAEHPNYPMTEYEARLVERGAAVWGVCAAPGPAPTPEQIAAGRAAEQSLMAYLPDDLESLAYVPLGMEAAVTNVINRRRRAAQRAQEQTLSTF